jgi:PAS domain S-box-containing protein
MGIGKNGKRPMDSTELRCRAEELLRSKSAERPPPRTKAEFQRLLHELAVCQIELEMQNSELLKNRDELETALMRLTDLYEFAPGGYFALDRGGVIRAANISGASLLGIVRSRLIGRRFISFLPQEERSAFIAFFRGVIASQGKDECEVTIKEAGKRLRHLRIEAVSSASATECRLAVLDITEQKRTEYQLRKSERRLAEAQGIAHIGSWEWDSVSDEITGSDEFNRIFGMVLTTYDSFMERVHPDDRETVDMAVRETLSRQAPYNVRYRIIHPDGITRAIHARGAAVTDDAGRTVRMIGTCHDITERMRIETEIERLASFPRLNPNPVLELDCGGKVTYCNMAAELILEMNNRSGCANPFIPKDLPELIRTLQGETSNTCVREVEIGGLFFMLRFHLVRQFDAIRIYGIDITERKRAEAALEILNAELKSANGDLEAFSYTVSHDLRSHLNSIYGFSQILLDTSPPLPDLKVRNSVLQIKTVSERMEQLITTILDFSRLSQWDINREEVALSGIASDIAAMLEMASPERRVRFLIAEGVSVCGDGKLLRIVLENLIINGWKYSARTEESVIEFGISLHDGKTSYFVRDNGVGFAMDQAEKLFTPFHRLPNQAEFTGHGIGLATVQRIVSRHGGRVWAESAPDKGATFYFTIPHAMQNVEPLRP